MAQLVHEKGKAGAVVVGVDGSESSLCALRHTAWVASAVGARLVVVYVRHLPNIAPGPVAGDAVAILEQTADDLERSTESQVAAALAAAGVDWRFEVRDGDPAHEILQVGHDAEAACIVVGAATHGPVSSVVLGSVANHLLHHSDISVVVVRPDR
ncbi:MAG TPA: universal stress protein [Acidimicrobiales bacterium]|nr:universal stress protein [Acidimicrobiales bacterium]